MERQAYLGDDTDDEEENPFGLSPLSSLNSSPDRSPKHTSPPLPPSPEKREDSSAIPRPPLNKAASNKLKSRAQRRKKRKAEKAALTPHEYKPRPGTRQKHVLEKDGLQTELISEDTRIASTGYVGIRTPSSSAVYSLKQLVGPRSQFGFDLVEWDGR